MARKPAQIKAPTRDARIGSPRLLTLKQASDEYGLTVWALRERIWAGQIPVVQFPGGRKQYIDRLDMENVIQINKRRIV
jgi:hypothetical protein